MEILSFGIQAPGLYPGVGEMFRFVGPTPGNRVLFLRIALPLSQICKEFPVACNSAWGYIAVAPAKVPTPKALTPRPNYRPRGTLYISGREGGQFLKIKPCYQGSDQQTETSHPPLGLGLVPGPKMKGFPLELFEFGQIQKIQPLYLYII